MISRRRAGNNLLRRDDHSFPNLLSTQHNELWLLLFLSWLCFFISASTSSLLHNISHQNSINQQHNFDMTSFNQPLPVPPVLPQPWYEDGYCRDHELWHCPNCVRQHGTADLHGNRSSYTLGRWRFLTRPPPSNIHLQQALDAAQQATYSSNPACESDNSSQRDLNPLHAAMDMVPPAHSQHAPSISAMAGPSFSNP